MSYDYENDSNYSLERVLELFVRELKSIEDMQEAAVKKHAELLKIIEKLSA